MLKQRIAGLTARQVLARMSAGDLPTYGGGYVVAGYFDDGARAARGVMRRLLRAGKVEFIGTSVTSRWRLVKGGSDA